MTLDISTHASSSFSSTEEDTGLFEAAEATTPNWDLLGDSIGAHHEALFRYARRKVATDDMADELVQETWLAALKALPNFAGRSTLRTWLTSILRRKIADYYRSRKETVALDPGRQSESEALPVDEYIIMRERADRVLGALHSLTPREREAVELCGLQELDRTEAAEQMGLSRPCLRVTLCRGRANLRELAKAS